MYLAIGVAIVFLCDLTFSSGASIYVVGYISDQASPG